MQGIDHTVIILVDIDPV